MPQETILQLGAVAIIFLFFIKEFFAFLRVRNGGNKISQEGNKIATELALMNQKLDNHIEHISIELVRIGACLKSNTDDTNMIKTAIAIMKEKLK